MPFAPTTSHFSRLVPFYHVMPLVCCLLIHSGGLDLQLTPYQVIVRGPRERFRSFWLDLAWYFLFTNGLCLLDLAWFYTIVLYLNMFKLTQESQWIARSWADRTATNGFSCEVERHRKFALKLRLVRYGIV